MVERDIALAKIAAIDRCLDRIATTRSASGRGLSPADAEDIALLNIQRAIQAAIDLAQHVIATEGYELPDSLGHTFVVLARRDVIDAQLGERLRRMVGFRNVLVHEYQALDPAIVDSILSDHLVDLRLLCSAVNRRFRIDPSLLD